MRAFLVNEGVLSDGVASLLDRRSVETACHLASYKNWVKQEG